jgi:hypothetical protein
MRLCKRHARRTGLLLSAILLSLLSWGCGGVTRAPAPSAPAVVVTVSPPSATVAPGQTVQFTATVTGASNTGVTWSVSGGGTISSSGLYTAPASPDSATVRATSTAAPGHSGSATVAVGVAKYTVTLTWVHSPSVVVGYNIYRSNQPGGVHTRLNALLQPGPSYDDVTVLNGRTYYYVVRAVGGTGQESAASNEAAVTIPSQ